MFQPLALAVCAVGVQTPDLIIDWFRLRAAGSGRVQAVVPGLGDDVLVVAPGGLEFSVARLDGDGSTIWELETQTPNSITIGGAAPDGSGGVLLFASRFGVGGVTTAHRVDAAGTLLWSTELLSPSGASTSGIIIQDAVEDGAGGIIGVGYEFEPGVGRSAKLFRIDGNGVDVGRTAPFGTSVAEFFAIDRAPNGDLAVATGYVGSNGRTNLVALFDSNLDLLWERQLGAVVSGRWARNVGFGGLGDVYVCKAISSQSQWPGMTPNGPNDTPNRGRVMRLSQADGSTVWEEELGSTEYVSGGNATAPAAGGGVFVGGFCKREQTGPGTPAVGLVQRFSADGEAGPARRFGRQPNDQVVFRGFLARPDGLLAYGISDTEEFRAPGVPQFGGIVVKLLPELGETYCGPAVSNSTGLTGVITAHGFPETTQNRVILRAQNLPGSAASLFIVGSARGTTPILGNGQGVLCIGGTLGRFSSGIGFARTDGVRELEIDLTEIPTPAGPVPALAGETWNFQCWYRDTNPMPTSNATDAVAVTFE